MQGDGGAGQVMLGTCYLTRRVPADLSSAENNVYRTCSSRNERRRGGYAGEGFLLLSSDAARSGAANRVLQELLDCQLSLPKNFVKRAAPH